MSSAGANKESEGGTMKNVVDNPETQPQSHTYAENQQNKNDGNHEQSTKSNSGSPKVGSTHANDESPGGTMKNVIDNPTNKSQSK